MGEAWFMGERRHTFDDFVERPIAEIPVDSLGSFLFELTSGISSFGDVDGEWSEWFGYCLPDLILRSHESLVLAPLLEHTISAFMNVHWSSELPTIYRTFPADVWSTLGRCLMKPELWTDSSSPRLGAVLGHQGGSTDALFWGRTSGDFFGGHVLRASLLPCRCAARLDRFGDRDPASGMACASHDLALGRGQAAAQSRLDHS
jgi:hypothetical protein